MRGLLSQACSVRRNRRTVYGFFVASVLICLLLSGRSPVAAAVRVPKAAQSTVSNAACQPTETFPQPPAGFDPLTASPTTLQEYGFPPQPPGNNSAALAGWTAAMQAVTSVSPPDPVCGTTPHESFTTNPIWSGNLVPSGVHGGQSYTWTESNWFQVAVTGDPNYTNYTNAPDTSFWTGMGQQYLIQAGADSIATSTPQYRFWTEDYAPGPGGQGCAPGGCTVWEGPVIRPGDTAYVYIDYLGGNSTYYWLENQTTGASQNFTNASPYVDLSSDEFINEWLGPYFPKFNDTEFFNNDFGNANNSWYLTTACVNYTMQESNGDMLAYSSNPGKTGNFYAYWNASS